MQHYPYIESLPTLIYRVTLCINLASYLSEFVSYIYRVSRYYLISFQEKTSPYTIVVDAPKLYVTIYNLTTDLSYSFKVHLLYSPP